MVDMAGSSKNECTEKPGDAPADQQPAEPDPNTRHP